MPEALPNLDRAQIEGAIALREERIGNRAECARRLADILKKPSGQQTIIDDYKAAEARLKRMEKQGIWTLATRNALAQLYGLKPSELVQAFSMSHEHRSPLQPKDGSFAATPPPPPDPLLLPYLNHIADECNVVWCPGMKSNEAPLRLLEVYANLHTVEPKPDREESHTVDKGQPAQERVSAVESLLKHPRLALLGEPGGGKSTFLRYLALQLARHHLRNRQDWADPAWQTSLPPELRDDLPVWIELRTLPAPGDATKDPPRDWLWSKLWEGEKLKALQAQHPGLRDLLEEAAAGGRVQFLLDGLDEVTDPDRREFIKQAVWQLVNHRHGRTTTEQGERRNGFVLTCRERTWFSNWKIEEWKPENNAVVRTVDRFDDDDRLAFLQRWFLERTHAIGAAGSAEAHAKEANGLAAKLAAELKDPRRNPGGRLESLASIPLNLTMIAWLRSRANEAGRLLPSTRAAIYEQTIHAILWELDEKRGLKGTNERTLPELVGSSSNERRRFGDCLAGIAFESLSTGQLEVLPSMDKTSLTQRLARFKSPQHWADHDDWATKVLRTVQCRSGLLKAERDDPGIYRFSHRSFQEYLAGVHLVTAGDFCSQALQWLRGRRDAAGPGEAKDQATARERLWEPLRLACGFLVVPVDQRQALFQYSRAAGADGPLLSAAVARELISELTGSGDWSNVWLAGELWLELDLPKAPPKSWASLKDRLQRRLVELIERGELTAFERAAAGRVLGHLGDPRPGVTPVAPFSMANPLFVWSQQFPFKPRERQPVLKGFKLGEGQIRDIETVYRLARYPVTVAQFALFATPENYANKELWTPAGLEWKETEQITGPHDFDEPVFQTPNHPRVGVSWYEARAYALWLNKTYPPEALGLPQGWQVRLPTEAEWKYAASMGGTRPYPFAAPPDWNRHGNINDTVIGHTTAVGLFPAGQAPRSSVEPIHSSLNLPVDDLVGNVWEWCRSRYQDDPKDAENENGNAARCVRGDFISDFALASYRLRYDPEYRYNSLGFRLAASPIL